MFFFLVCQMHLFIEGQCTEYISVGEELYENMWMEDLPAEAASSM